ncbi:MAG: exosortase W [Candidatus Methylomirabilis sp.]|nr:exosortase W [Deltaproteobacteria bacterium]
MHSEGRILPSPFQLKLGALAVLFALAYGGAISHMVRTWSTSNTYSHGFLVPFISLYFIWKKRGSLSSLPSRPSLVAGPVAVAATSILLAAGHVSSLVIVQQISIVLAIPGLVLMLMGWSFLRALALPLSYLLLMVPALDVLIERIQFPFQLLTARMAAEFLQLFNFPVYLNRQFIEMPNITLEVARACSGVQYLVAIIALAIPLAYLNHTGRTRLLLLALAVVIGIVTNWFRVILIALWSYAGGEVLHGPMHVFQGLFVAVAGFFILFIISLALTWSGRRSGQSGPEGKSAAPYGVFSMSNAAFVSGALLLAATAAYIHLYRIEPVHLAEPLRRLPLEIADWKGADRASRGELPFLMKGADSELYRTYTGPSGSEVRVYVAYFTAQTQGKELVRHEHAAMFGSERLIELPYGEGAVSANLAAYSGTSDYLVLYWYSINGRHITGKIKAKLLTLMDGVFRKRTNGAVVMIFWDAMAEGGAELDPERAGFIKALLPAIESRIGEFDTGERA